MTTAELIAARRSEPWREELRKSKKNKERTDIPRVEMNELDPEYRSHTYSLRHMPTDELKAYKYPYEKFQYVINQEIEIR